jgi:hypothetical protein
MTTAGVSWSSDNEGLLIQGADTVMTRKKTPNETEPVGAVTNDPDDLKGTLKHIGGSRSDDWNDILAIQAVDALWKHSIPEKRGKQ